MTSRQRSALPLLLTLIAAVSEPSAQCDTWTPLGSGIDAPIATTLESVAALTTLPNGDIIAGGTFTQAGGTSANYIARWNGSNWLPLGSGMNNPVKSLITMPNGDVIAGGLFTTAGGVTVNRVARWDGVNWSPLGSGMNGPVDTFTVLPNGDLVAGGGFPSAGGVSVNRIARWDGSNWSALGPGLNGTVTVVSTLANGDLIAGGAFATLNFSRIARWDGGSWQPLGTGFNGNPFAFATLANGDLVAAGAFTEAGGVAVNRVARWNGSTWSPLGAGTNWPIFALTPLPNGEIIAAGQFIEAGGAPANYVARWDGASWLPIGSGLSGPQSTVANALCKLPNNDVIIGGRFDVAGGISAIRIARYTPCLAKHVSYGTGCYTPALSLSASPNPTSTATTGTTVTYAIDDIPDATGTSGVHFGATIVSFGGNVPGVDLGIIGAAGCNAHVDSLDLLFAFFGAGTNNTTALAIPPGVPPGTELFAQAVAITDNGLLNAAGLTTSNGVRSVVYAD